MPDSPLSRRKFLKRGLAAAALLGCGACGGANGEGASPQTLIVGGGLAGLRLLDRLTLAGHPARLLEAAPRLGGRIRTLRRGLPVDTWAELGAERVPANHSRLQALIRDLDLELVDYPGGTGRLVLRHGGLWVPVDTSADLPPDLRAGLDDRELAVWPPAVEKLYCSVDMEPTGASREPALAYLRSRGLTAPGERLARAFSPLPLERVSALDWWRSTADMLRMGRSQTVRGGVDRIISALVRRHSKLITSGAAVTRVALGESAVHVDLADGSSLRAAHVALAMPLAPLRRLAFAGGTPDVVKQATQGLAIAEEIKVHVEYDVRALAAAGVRPYCMGLEFPRMTWPSPGVSPEGRGVLNTMAVREDVPLVREARARGDDALRNLLRDRLPPELRLGRKVHAHDFNADPLIGGTFTYVAAGNSPLPAPRREGRLTLCGSDLSGHSGWMEGALQSADAAFEEIMKS